MFTTDQVRKLARESGDKQQWHSDGRSLYVVTKNGRGFWVLHFRDPREGGAIRNTGLGAVDDVTPAAARRRRDDIMADLRNGRPVAIMTRKAAAIYSRQPPTRTCQTTRTNGTSARARPTPR